MNSKRRNRNADPDRLPHPHRSYIGARGFEKNIEGDAVPGGMGDPEVHECCAECGAVQAGWPWRSHALEGNRTRRHGSRRVAGSDLTGRAVGDAGRRKNSPRSDVLAYMKSHSGMANAPMITVNRKTTTATVFRTGSRRAIASK